MNSPFATRLDPRVRPARGAREAASRGLNEGGRTTLLMVPRGGASTKKSGRGPENT